MDRYWLLIGSYWLM